MGSKKEEEKLKICHSCEYNKDENCDPPMGECKLERLLPEK